MERPVSSSPDRATARPGVEAVERRSLSRQRADSVLDCRAATSTNRLLNTKHKGARLNLLEVDCRVPTATGSLLFVASSPSGHSCLVLRRLLDLYPDRQIHVIANNREVLSHQSPRLTFHAYEGNRMTLTPVQVAAIAREHVGVIFYAQMTNFVIDYPHIFKALKDVAAKEWIAVDSLFNFGAKSWPSRAPWARTHSRFPFSSPPGNWTTCTTWPKTAKGRDAWLKSEPWPAARRLRSHSLLAIPAEVSRTRSTSLRAPRCMTSSMHTACRTWST